MGVMITARHEDDDLRSGRRRGRSGRFTQLAREPCDGFVRLGGGRDAGPRDRGDRRGARRRARHRRRRPGAAAVRARAAHAGECRRGIRRRRRALRGQLGQLGEFRTGAQWSPERALSAGQADALRRMLLAVVTDPRLVLVRLADQLRRMRRARELEEPARLQLARETREVYAPLANRLGSGSSNGSSRTSPSATSSPRSIAASPAGSRNRASPARATSRP